MNKVDDNKYWDKYYRIDDVPKTPSNFAVFVAEHVNTGESLLDLGCGNGRDAVYFQGLDINVTALDKSVEAINCINIREPGIHTVVSEMDMLSIHFDAVFNHVYSRFSIHAISDEQQTQTFKEIYAVLQPHGSLWIEARCTEDELYGKGVSAGRNAYIYNDHYRRFLALDEIICELASIGFEIIYAEKARGFAPCKSEDPIVLRIRSIKQ